MDIRIIEAPKFQYFGGKANLRRYIARWMPLSGTSYVEPFCGRGNMFFLSKMITDFQKYHINDIRTIPFFDSIRSFDGKELPFIEYGTPIEDVLAIGENEARLLEPLLCWAGADYSTTKKALSTPRRMDNYSRSITRAKTLLSGVITTCEDAVSLIDSYSDDPDAFLYIDPPYLNCNVAPYSEKDFDYRLLIESLLKSKCRWILSEYQNPVYDEAFGEPHVRYYTKTMLTNGRKPRDSIEVLYGNCIAEKPHRIDFQESQKSPFSTKRLYRAGELLTRDQVYSRMPIHWDKKNFDIEFSILIKDPDCYWNGRELLFLETYLLEH